MRRLDWKELEEFPNHAVSEHGDVANMKTGLPRKLSVNQQGVVKLSMYDEHGRLKTRSVARLVAESFLEPHPNELFNTPIHLDGDLRNCRADNLAWRPLWFAVKYHKQFRNEDFYHMDVLVMDVESEVVYENVKDVCISNGMYWYDVVKSYTEDVPVFPDWKTFTLVR
jgi:hypothetical protein